MTTKIQPVDFCSQQQAVVQEAIERLQALLGEMTSTVNPESATWRDVSQFAGQTDAVRGMIERLDEQ